MPKFPRQKNYLAAIWVKGHEILGDFHVNFGGKYFYSFKGKRTIKITQKENPEFIPGFYHDLNKNLSLVSAVVGNNGAGKSTLMGCIRSILNPSHYNLHAGYSGGLYIYEDAEGENATYYLLPLPSFDQIKVEFSNGKLLNFNQIIYYNPFLELKQSFFDFDHTPDIDLSLDRIIEKDISLMDQKRSNNPLLEHKYQSIFRRIYLLSNNTVVKKIDSLNIPTYSRIKLFIKGPYHNSNRDAPLDEEFHEMYEFLFKKATNEFTEAIQDWNKEANYSQKRKYIKALFLRELITTVFEALDIDGETWYYKGRNNIKLELIKNKRAKDAFFDFLDKHTFENDTNIKLPTREIKYLVTHSFAIIDKLRPNDFEMKDAFYVDFHKAQKILTAHLDLINKLAKFSVTPGFINPTPAISLSSGEKAYLDLFAKFYTVKDQIEKIFSPEQLNQKTYPTASKNLLILIDEGDIGFHPQWKKTFIKTIGDILPALFNKVKDLSIQIIFTTHDPLTLSDIPNYNVVYLKKEGDNNRVLNIGDKDRPSHSFGANISDLFSDSFFITDGLVGEYAVEKINKTIKWLNDPKEKEEKKYHKNLISLIDEPLLKIKLSQMYSEKTNDTSLEKETIEKQIKRLQM